MQRLPSRLARDPILEATFEFRFLGKEQAVADVLQGIIYPELKTRFPKIRRTALAAFAPELLDDPSLRYQPRLSLRGENQLVNIGDRAIAVASTRPYMGWRRLRPLVLEVLELVRKADIVKEAERISLRYTNILRTGSFAEQFSTLNFKAALGRTPYDLTNMLTHVRTEVMKDDLITILEIGANTVVGDERGLSLAIDSIYKSPPNFLNDPAAHVDKVHNVEKQIFFDLLTDETISSMGPEYE